MWRRPSGLRLGRVQGAARNDASPANRYRIRDCSTFGIRQGLGGARWVVCSAAGTARFGEPSMGTRFAVCSSSIVVQGGDESKLTP